jgi:AraC family transcriptional regulator of arabinose operon
MTIDLLLKLMFIKISNYIDDRNDVNKFNKYYDILTSLRTEIYLHPNQVWNIPALAKKVNLSPSYFQYLYKKSFGCSCINDVINSRITYAKYNLTMTSYTIKEIGMLCGYNNEEFFLRQFKKTTGYTPSEYRKMKRN